MPPIPPAGACAGAGVGAAALGAVAGLGAPQADLVGEAEAFGADERPNMPPPPDDLPPLLDDERPPPRGIFKYK